ncbi:MAG: ABC transporter substrate-binding protein [Pseudomonadota bacterium]
MKHAIRSVAVACVVALTAITAFADPPQRVVIAGGDLTEIAFALGAGSRVVGVDQTSNWPTEVAELPQIGYVRRLSAEGILSLAPDLVIAADDAGPALALDQITAAGVAVHRAPTTDRIEDIPAKITSVGAALDRLAEAEALAHRFETTHAEIKRKVETLPNRPRVLFVLAVRNGAPLVAGSGTSADTMITAAGADNAATGFEGFKPMSREAIIATKPEVLLMMEQHAGREGGIEAVLLRPEIRMTPAGQARRAVTMEGMLLLGFGPRTPDAIAELARRLHPEDARAAGL